MIPVKLYAVILPKHIAEQQFQNGISDIKKSFPDHFVTEDEYLYAIHGKYVTHMATATEILIKKGIEFSEKDNRSNSFAVIAKEGIWWTVDWLIVQNNNCWFIADIDAPI